MEEEIKLIEENIDYNSLIFGYGDAELSEKLRNAIRHLIQAYKEDEEVIKLLIKDIEEEQNCVQNPTKCSKSCYVCIEEEYRNKVKEKKVIE